VHFVGVLNSELYKKHCENNIKIFGTPVDQNTLFVNSPATTIQDASLHDKYRSVPLIWYSVLRFESGIVM
jgi:hypothetical protein